MDWVIQLWKGAPTDAHLGTMIAIGVFITGLLVAFCVYFT